MPWTQKQHKLFQTAAHSPEFAAKVGIPVGKAREMASEGVKKDSRSRGEIMALMIQKRK